MNGRGNSGGSKFRVQCHGKLDRVGPWLRLASSVLKGQPQPNYSDWVLIGYDGNSKTDMTVLEKGNGSVEGVSAKLPPGVPVFGGIRLSKKDRFVQFLYIDEDCPAMKRGRTLMYKNGMFECRKRVILFLCWCEELVVSIQNDKRLRMMNSLTSSTVALILPVLSFVY